MRGNCFSSGTELFNLKLSLFKQRKFSELLGKLCLVMCAALRTFISFYWKSNIVEGNINCLDSLAVYKCSLEEMGPVVADLEKLPRFLPLETL